MRIAAKEKAAVAAITSAAIFAGIYLGYMGDFKRFFEMTFLSNVIAASVLLFASISLFFTGRDIPHFLYLDMTAMLIVVVCVCGIFAPGRCFYGRSAVLHLVDPILVTVFYIMFCDGRPGIKTALTAEVFPIAYYVFMIAYGKASGSSVYTYFDTNIMSGARLFGFFIAAAALVFFAAIALVLVNRLLHGSGAVTVKNAAYNVK